MMLFRCDRCGKTEPAKEGCDYAEDWEEVTVSGAFHYHVCPACGQLLFAFFIESAKME